MTNKLFSTFGIVLIVVLGIGIICSSFIFDYLTYDTVTVTVDSKERIDSESHGYYLVYSQKEVFKNDDSLSYWKWDSSDFHAKIQPGKTYELEVYGWRWPFFSMYRNIIGFKEASSDAR